MILNEQLIHEFHTFINEARGRNRIISGDPTDDDLKRAILNRNYVGIYYEDETKLVMGGFRLIEPYLFGTGYKFSDGTIKYSNRGYLRSYIIKSSQSEGLPFNRKSVSLSDRDNGWRMFRRDRITEWFTFPYKFSRYREGYTPDDRHIFNIMYNLSKDEYPLGEQKE